jgi:hypothetical protein|tara:strand:+ start:130 stop:564 length:435 start_codon:yes stop_codon:yes gene_type:complete
MKLATSLNTRRLRPLLEVVYIYGEKGALKQEGRKMATQAQRERSCADQVQERLKDRLKDLHTLEGLCFDYVDPNTFTDQKEGYWRWQLSWGGPGDEFRIYVNPDKSVHRIEYWYLDWYDGAKVTLGTQQHSDAWSHMEDMVAAT